jgi:hypothetical protein
LVLLKPPNIPIISTNLIFKQQLPASLNVYASALRKKSADQILIFFLALSQKDQSTDPFKPVHPHQAKFRVAPQSLKSAHLAFPSTAVHENGQAPPLFNLQNSFKQQSVR